MIISEKQLLLLIDILKDSVKLNIDNQFCISFEQRVELYRVILKQQSDVLREIKE